MLRSLIFLLGCLSLSTPREVDWLVDTVTTPVTLTSDGKAGIVLSNGLISRSFLLSPDFGTVDFKSLISDNAILRAISPEATVTLDGEAYNVGGLLSSSPPDYINNTDVTYQVDPTAFHYASHTISQPVAPFHWEPGLRHSPSDSKWPPQGLTLQVKFIPPAVVKRPEHANVTVVVSYEMYVGIPLMSKWVSVFYSGISYVRIDGCTVELLATQKPYAPFTFASYPFPVDHDFDTLTSSWLFVDLTISTSSYGYGGTISWGGTSNQYSGADQPYLTVYYSSGPGVFMAGNSQAGKRLRDFPQPALTEFDSFKALLLVTDSHDRERVSLSRARMTRILTPQTQENPIFFHLTNVDQSAYVKAINQSAEVGFEMIIFSFGSSFDLENTSPDYVADILLYVEYALERDIEVGGYDLICRDRGNGGYGGNVGDQWDTVDPSSGQLGSDACFASGWEDVISNMFLIWVQQGKLKMFETDGPFGGTPCSSHNHSHHWDLEDSIYWQNRLQGEFFVKLKEYNIFFNTPDWYFHYGTNKIGMGYDENQYSLPRWQDLTISRQGMYDDTYSFIPTQGWMQVPLVDYHGGGSAAAFEPLTQNLLEYEWALAQYLGYGVAACYRGYELYDSPTAEALVKKWVGFYKDYRDILISDIVHVRRPDMQDFDCILHVNPRIFNRGLAMVFNPTGSTLSWNLTLPLYYTGISNVALVAQEGIPPPTTYSLDRDYTISIPVKMAPTSITWFVILSGD